MHCSIVRYLFLSVAFLFGNACTVSEDNAETGDTPDSGAVTHSSPPNILLILADDLGFSDTGPFGSEIKTPNLNALANKGKVLTRFHTAIACNPTRAALFSGIDNNLSGIGARSVYHLNPGVVSLATVLRDGGYRTFMAGKWDLGKTPETIPHARGFERSFALVNGSASHFNEPSLPSREPAYYENGNPVELPEDFYSTFFYTDKMLEYLDSTDEQPFFAYLSYTAPHWPLQVPDEYRDLYRGVYDNGYQAVRDARIASMKELGILSGDFVANPGYDWPDWAGMSEREKQAEVKRMELHAAMIELMDRGIGRILDKLEQMGKLDNTLIVFMSDNGPDGSNHVPVVVDHGGKGMDNSLENMGRKGSYESMGHYWGQVSSVPFRLYKYHSTEGGINTPAIAVWPGHIKPGKIADRFMAVTDLFPTLLEAAGIEEFGDTYNNRPVLPVQGKNQLAYLLDEDGSPYPDDFEYGWSYSRIDPLINLAIRKGPWKLVWEGDETGQVPEPRLFNLDEDPAEIYDLYSSHPEQRRMLEATWQRYADRNNIDRALP